ncbi:MAG: hypothetical protein WCK91_01060 [bacterium]
MQHRFRSHIRPNKHEKIAPAVVVPTPTPEPTISDPITVIPSITPDPILVTVIPPITPPVVDSNPSQGSGGQAGPSAPDPVPATNQDDVKPTTIPE